MATNAYLYLYILYFSLIRLEFNQSHLDYYTELDAVILYGKPAQNDPHEESKPTAAANKSEVSLTAKLFRQLSLSDKKAEGQEDLEHNGYFDILPVGHLHIPGAGSAGFKPNNLIGHVSYLDKWFLGLNFV